jgi:hypothetical protein
MRRDWNDDEIMYLYRAVKTETVGEAAAHLNRTINSVQSKVYKLGIKFKHQGTSYNQTSDKGRTWTFQEEIELLGLLEKMTLPKIAEELGRPYWSVVSKSQRMNATRGQGVYTIEGIARLLQVGGTTVRRHMRLLNIQRTGGYIRDERYISMIAQSLIDGNDARLKPSIVHLRNIVRGEWSKAA